MKVQEAIEKIKMILEEATSYENAVCYVTSNDREALQKSIEALEKQIPKNWIAEDIGEGDYAWTCPSCNSVFVLMDGTPQDNEYNYCPNCGQAMAERKGSVV